MSITQRHHITQSGHHHLSKEERNSTQLLEKILLSSSSQLSSSHKQQSSHGNTMGAKIILQTQDMNSNDQNTYRGGPLNHTGKNWRKLITPAQDSFKKMNQPEYSGYNPGSRVTTQNDRPLLGGIGATTNSNNTSMDTGGNYSSVKEFSPATNADLK